MTDISGSNTVSDGYNKPYTPTTEEVRQQWGWNYPDYDNEDVAFDRWLGAVKAQAVSEWLAERMAAFEKVTLEDYEQGETE